jgi:hypothetical protein
MMSRSTLDPKDKRYQSKALDGEEIDVLRSGSLSPCIMVQIVLQIVYFNL